MLFYKVGAEPSHHLSEMHSHLSPHLAWHWPEVPIFLVLRERRDGDDKPYYSHGGAQSKLTSITFCPFFLVVIEGYHHHHFHSKVRFDTGIV